ncbi:MAG: glycosyltransferase family 4 protein [Salinivirgaceae bacterium]
MKLGFDAKRLFNNFTGLGNYSRTLVSGINQVAPEHELYLFTPKKKYHNDSREFFKEPYQAVTPKTRFKAYWRSVSSVRKIKQLKLDIFHGLSHELPLGIKKTGVKSVVTIHDLIYKTYPNDFSLFDRLIYDFKFTYACKNADKIIAVSQSTKNDIVKYYGTPESKIEVIYQSCHQQFKQTLSTDEISNILLPYQLPNQFMLFVGSIIERKNLLNLIKAIELLPETIKLPLVVVGKGNSYLKKVNAYIKEKKLEDRIVFAPQVRYKDLPALYQKASVFIYPSVYEGFGIPVIEALWSKTPVITSNCSSMPEAAGDGAFLCNPKEPASIAEGIAKIIGDKNYAQELIEKGSMHIKRFENDVVTKQVLSLYQSLLNK